MYMVSIAIDSVTFEIQSGRRNPDGIEAHILDVVEFGDERLVSPAAVQSVGSITRRSLGCRGKAVGNDSGQEDIISKETWRQTLMVRDARRTDRSNENASHPLSRTGRG